MYCNSTIKGLEATCSLQANTAVYISLLTHLILGMIHQCDYV